MKLQETKNLLEILKMAYPSTYKNMAEGEAKSIVKFYHGFFSKYETPIVVQALRNYISKNQYPPTIAGLQEQIDLLLPQEETDIVLWNQLKKAISNCLWDSQKVYDSLPEPLRIWVGGPSGLRDLAMVESEKIETVTRGQFLRTIKIIKERAKAQAELPEEIRQAIAGLKLIGGKENETD